MAGEREQREDEDLKDRRIIGSGGLRDRIGYYGSRQADNPATRIAEQHFHMPYGHYNPERRHLQGSSPGWPLPGGPFTGMGPRGYRRSDERIKDDVAEQLTLHGWVDARDITVDVHEGEVTLEGTVGDRETKRLAEDVALSVTGVVDVHNELQVRTGRAESR